MSRAFFALSITALVLTQYSCSLSGSDASGSPRLETAVSGTLTAVPNGDPGSSPLQKTEIPLTGLIDDHADNLAIPAFHEEICVAYTDHGNVWIREGNQTPRQLTENGNTTRVILSSDGEWIAYLQANMIGEDVELRIVKVHGSGDRVILDQSDFDSLYPLEQARHLLPGQIQLLPGTHRLLFNIQVVVDGPTRLRKDDVLAIDLDVGNLERVLPPGRGGNFHASPDGSSLAIIQPTSIGIADVDDADSYLELLTYPAVDTYSGNQYYPEPVWSSDSSSFAVALPSPDPLVPDPTTAVWVFYTDGSAPVQTASIRGQTYFPQAFGAPVISPDLSRIAFLRPGREQNEEHLIISDEDDGDELRYTTGDLRWIGWAPNSSVFAYSLGPSHLEVGRIGEPPIPIGPGSQFRWINDQQYLYLTGTDDNWHLLRGIPGGRAERITQLSGTDVVYDFILCSPSTK